MSGNPYQKTSCFKNILKMCFNKTQREIRYKYYQYSAPEHNDATSSSEGKLESLKKDSDGEGKKKSEPSNENPVE